MILLGLYFFKRISVYFLPKLPVPPVIKIFLPLNTITLFIEVIDTSNLMTLATGALFASQKQF